MIRVFLADDHGIVRAGVRQFLELAGDITVVGEAGDGRRALDALEALGGEVDVLLLDLTLPRLSGTEVLRAVRARFPRIAVLVLSMHRDELYTQQVLALGAAGYLCKERSEDELLAALRAVAGGGLYGSRASVRLGEPIDAAPPHAALSPREHQIFTLLIDGRSPSEAAAELDLTGSTISTHIARIKAKLKVSSIAGIVSYAHRAGLVG